MQTITIDIINNNALKLLKDLESLQLIRLHNQKSTTLSDKWLKKYKGSMAKQSIADVDSQLNQLRNEWE